MAQGGTRSKIRSGGNCRKSEVQKKRWSSQRAEEDEEDESESYHLHDDDESSVESSSSSCYSTHDVPISVSVHTTAAHQPQDDDDDSDSTALMESPTRVRRPRRRSRHTTCGSSMQSSSIRSASLSSCCWSIAEEDDDDEDDDDDEFASDINDGYSSASHVSAAQHSLRSNNNKKRHSNNKGGDSGGLSVLYTMSGIPLPPSVCAPSSRSAPPASSLQVTDPPSIYAPSCRSSAPASSLQSQVTNLRATTGTRSDSEDEEASCYSQQTDDEDEDFTIATGTSMRSETREFWRAGAEAAADSSSRRSTSSRSTTTRSCSFPPPAGSSQERSKRALAARTTGEEPIGFDDFSVALNSSITRDEDALAKIACVLDADALAAAGLTASPATVMTTLSPPKMPKRTSSRKVDKDVAGAPFFFKPQDLPTAVRAEIVSLRHCLHEREDSSVTAANTSPRRPHRTPVRVKIAPPRPPRRQASSERLTSS